MGQEHFVNIKEYKNICNLVKSNFLVWSTIGVTLGDVTLGDITLGD